MAETAIDNVPMLPLGWVERSGESLTITFEREARTGGVGGWWHEPSHDLISKLSMTRPLLSGTAAAARP